MRQKPGLKTGVENGMFWSDSVGLAFGEPHTPTENSEEYRPPSPGAGA